MPEAAAVLVTGAAQGLGRAVAQAFHASGWRVALLDIDKRGLSDLQNELGENAAGYHVDLTDAADTQTARRPSSTGFQRKVRFSNTSGFRAC